MTDATIRMTPEQKMILVAAIRQIALSNAQDTASVIRPSGLMEAVKKCWDTLDFKFEDGMAKITCEF